MSVYNRGDVVLVMFPFDDNDKVKLRPALVLDVISGSSKTCQITSVNKTGQLPGKWVLKDSTVGIEMGLKFDSFISTGNRFMLSSSQILMKIGYCTIIDEIDPPKK